MAQIIIRRFIFQLQFFKVGIQVKTWIPLFPKMSSKVSKGRLRQDVENENKIQEQIVFS